MVQAADFGNLDDLARRGPLDRPQVGRILVEREVSARPVIVREVAGQDAAQVSFAEDEDVIQTLAPDRADEPLREGVLPRAVRRGQDFTDSHALHSLPERVTVDRVAIAEEIGRRGVVREGVHDLLGRPGRGGMLGDVEVEDAPAMVGEHDEDEEDAQARGGHREEIDRDQVPDVVGEERAPGLRRAVSAASGAAGRRCARPRRCRASGVRHGFWGRPRGDWPRPFVLTRALISALTGGRPAGGPAGERGPVLAEAAPLPPQDGVGSHDHEDLPPACPHPGQPDPEEAIASCAAWAESPFSCTRRAAGARRGSRGRAGGGRRRGTGRVEADFLWFMSSDLFLTRRSCCRVIVAR